MTTFARRLAIVAVLAALFTGLGDRDAPQAERLPELDVIMVLDRTTSMSALDEPDGSRISAAVHDLGIFARELESARFTIITVGATADVVLPPTTDRFGLQTVLRDLTTEPADVGTGSFADRAVPEVTGLLDDDEEDEEDEEDERLAVLVYAGDGEDTGGDPALRFGGLEDRLAGALVLGYGTRKGGVMPLVLLRGDEAETRTYVPDPATGEDAVSRSDPARLVAIADEVGGTHLEPESDQEVVTAADELQQRVYADLPPVEPARQLSWAWGLLLLLLALPDLRTGWRTWWAARRAVRP